MAPPLKKEPSKNERKPPPRASKDGSRFEADPIHHVATNVAMLIFMQSMHYYVARTHLHPPSTRKKTSLAI